MHAGSAPLTCCGKNMMLLEESVTDAAVEKHIPVLESTEKGYDVKVGSVAHPATEEHHIEWVELIIRGGKRRVIEFLDKTEDPKTSFLVCDSCKKQGVTAREYCNLHGLWKS